MKIFKLTAHINEYYTLHNGSKPAAIYTDTILARGQNMAVAKFSRIAGYQYPNYRIDVVSVKRLNYTITKN